MKNRMWKMFTVNNNNVYWDKIDKLVNDHNNARHSSIKMTPVEVSKNKNKSKVWSNLYGDLIYLNPGKPNFAIGDKVRISKYKKKVFDKGYTPKRTKEIFVIGKVLPTKPVTYSIVDLMNEAIKGSFYEQELNVNVKGCSYYYNQAISLHNKLILAVWFSAHGMESCQDYTAFQKRFHG